MELLVFLATFGMDVETLKRKIQALGRGVVFEERGLVLEVKAEHIDIKELIYLEEVERIAEVKSAWKELKFSELERDAFNALKGKEKRYKIQVKFYEKIKISASSLYRHVNPFLRREGFVPDEEKWDSLLYLELRKNKGIVEYKCGVSERFLWEKGLPVKVNMENLNVVLENPSLKEEVADFLRVCWIFKLPLIIVTKEKDFARLLEKAKEETKGIIYNEFKLKVVNSFKEEGILVGFSKRAVKNEKELKTFLKKEEKKKIFFVFGDDKFGLTQEMRDRLNISLRLTPEAKKPLRASHALSYVLGFYTAEKL